jgi:hypothetical protein
MKEKTRLSEIDTLHQRLDAQESEIERLKALVGPDDKGKNQPSRSRRDVLKLAGAAMVGAAGAAALRVVPAAAANGDPITVGGSFTGTTVTQLSTTGSDSIYGAAPTFGAGVIGYAASTSGVGVRGYASGVTGNGVQGFGGALGGLFDGTRAPITLTPKGTAGPPATGAHSVGDLWTDVNGIVWACITAGTPGVFAPLQTGGANITHFVKVRAQQYTLTNNDGATWVDMDAVNLVQTITPLFNAQAVISVSTDLWTANAGFNQDIGIFISGGIFVTGKIVAWKESGGFAGTFSPNAAFVETTQPLVAGTTYTIKVRWKTNKPGTSAIFAGAGPLPAGSAGGGVAGQFSPTRLATHLVVDVPSPSILTIPANDASKTPAPSLPVRPDGRSQ